MHSDKICASQEFVDLLGSDICENKHVWLDNSESDGVFVEKVGTFLRLSETLLDMIKA